MKIIGWKNRGGSGYIDPYNGSAPNTGWTMVLNIGFLSKPLSARQMLFGTVAIVVLLGVYCLAYNGLRGDAVTAADAFSWPIINIVPFFVAWELAKNRPWVIRMGALAIACATSLYLDFLYSAEFMPAFEAVRRIPAIALAGGMFATLDRSLQRTTTSNPQSGELPLLPSQILRVTSAGNYVLLHTDNGSVIHRSPLQSVESSLERHGFVRVHRTTLVRRDTIAKVRGSDIILADGSSVRTGARYRELLQAA
jgi:LytTr DNA-binding domain